jgi:hypothetical protein
LVNRQGRDHTAKFPEVTTRRQREKLAEYLK